MASQPNNDTKDLYPTMMTPSSGANQDRFLKKKLGELNL